MVFQRGVSSSPLMLRLSQTAGQEIRSECRLGV
jgi:hypothetical protein